MPVPAATSSKMKSTWELWAATTSASFLLRYASTIRVSSVDSSPERTAAVRRHLNLDSRIGTSECDVHRREKRAAAEARKSQAQCAALDAAQRVELREEIRALRKELDGARVHDPTRGRQLAAPADSVKEHDAELVLELLHRLADGRLGGEGRARCLREAALPDDFGEEPQPA